MRKEFLCMRSAGFTNSGSIRTEHQEFFRSMGGLLRYTRCEWWLVVSMYLFATVPCALLLPAFAAELPVYNA